VYFLVELIGLSLFLRSIVKCVSVEEDVSGLHAVLTESLGTDPRSHRVADRFLDSHVYISLEFGFESDSHKTYVFTF